MCNYRNCNKQVEGRKGKKYCNTSCRKMEQTYNKRDMEKLRRDKKGIQKIIQQINDNKDIQMLELFKKIYG